MLHVVFLEDPIYCTMVLNSLTQLWARAKKEFLSLSYSLLLPKSTPALIFLEGANLFGCSSAVKYHVLLFASSEEAFPAACLACCFFFSRAFFRSFFHRNLSICLCLKAEVVEGDNSGDVF